MKKVICLAVICTVFCFGCAGKKSVTVFDSSFTKPSNPTEIGKVYLENIYDLRYKDSLYGLLSEETKMTIGATGFAVKVEEVSKTIDLTDAFKQVVVLDAFVFDQNRMVVYYVMFCEKELSGVYFVVELYFNQQYGSWRIDLTGGDKKFSLVPLIEQGDLGLLTRKRLTDLKRAVSDRIDNFKKEMIPEKPVSYQESKPDQMEKEIKRELVVGKIYFETGNLKNARKSFERILFLDPEQKEAREFLQKTLNAIRLKEESIKKSAEKASKIPVSLKPEPIAPSNDLKPKKPVVKQEKTKSIEEKLYRICFDKGKVLYDAGEYRKAIVQFQKALNFKTDDERAKNYIKKSESAIQIIR